ncbi:hypothetical protein Hanom_Chr17g01529731 [Helianthus anomalus]
MGRGCGVGWVQTPKSSFQVGLSFGVAPWAGVSVRGRGLWRGLGTNAQVTTPGGLGFRRDPLGGGFSPGVGRGYQDDMAGSHWPRQVAVWASRWPTAMC